MASTIDLVKKIKELFVEKINKKTGWGTKEAIQQLDEAIGEAALTTTEDKIKE